ncbi:MAG: hypothetical protein WCJ51_04045 [Candidatus Moraniibacteriota bacterium]
MSPGFGPWTYSDYAVNGIPAYYETDRSYIQAPSKCEWRVYYPSRIMVWVDGILVADQTENHDCKEGHSVCSAAPAIISVPFFNPPADESPGTTHSLTIQRGYHALNGFNSIGNPIKGTITTLAPCPTYYGYPGRTFTAPENVRFNCPAIAPTCPCENLQDHCAGTPYPDSCGKADACTGTKQPDCSLSESQYCSGVAYTATTGDCSGTCNGKGSNDVFSVYRCSHAPVPNFCDSTANCGKPNIGKPVCDVQKSCKNAQGNQEWIYGGATAADCTGENSVQCVDEVVGNCPGCTMKASPHGWKEIAPF